MSVSIVLPIHNESENLAHSLHLLLKALKGKLEQPYEVILIENGSTDRSWEICKEFQNKYPDIIRTIHLSTRSYGLAIREGIYQSALDHIILFNVDFWDIAFLIKSVALLSTCDIVVGSKTLITSNDGRPFLRRQITYWFNVLLRAFYNFPGTDTHGIKALKKQSILPIAKSCYPLRELYDTQLVLRACKKNLIYTELPVSVHEKRPTRYPAVRRTINLLHDLVVIFRYRYL